VQDEQSPPQPQPFSFFKYLTIAITAPIKAIPTTAVPIKVPPFINPTRLTETLLLFAFAFTNH